MIRSHVCSSDAWWLRHPTLTASAQLKVTKLKPRTSKVHTDESMVTILTRTLWSTYPVRSLAVAFCQTVAYVLSMNIIFNFAGKEGLYCCIDFAAIVFNLLPIRDTFD